MWEEIRQEGGAKGGDEGGHHGFEEVGKILDSVDSTTTTMFRLTRPLASSLKRTTGITGLLVHPNPLPELTKTYESTLTVLASIPQTSVYRQGAEALTRHKLKIVQESNGDIGAVEKQLNEGQIEESLDIAGDELQLAGKMVKWKAWEPLAEKAEAGQWM